MRNSFDHNTPLNSPCNPSMSAETISSSRLLTINLNYFGVIWVGRVCSALEFSWCAWEGRKLITLFLSAVWPYILHCNGVNFKARLVFFAALEWVPKTPGCNHKKEKNLYGLAVYSPLRSMVVVACLRF